jgi:hypothetical protein
MDNQHVPVATATTIPQPNVQTIAPPPAPGYHHTANWLMLLMLFVFPPVGWYFMWKEKEYHTWFATTIFIYGLFGFVLNAMLIVIIAPMLPGVLDRYGIADRSFIPTPSLLILGILIADAQMFFGIYLWRIVKKQGKLGRKILFITAILLFVNYIIPTVSAIISLWWIINTFNTVKDAAGLFPMIPSGLF